MSQIWRTKNFKLVRGKSRCSRPAKTRGRVYSIYHLNRPYNLPSFRRPSSNNVCVDEAVNVADEEDPVGGAHLLARNAEARVDSTLGNFGMSHEEQIGSKLESKIGTSSTDLSLDSIPFLTPVRTADSPRIHARPTSFAPRTTSPLRSHLHCSIPSASSTNI